MPSITAVWSVSRSRNGRKATTCRCRAGSRISAAMIRGSTELSAPPIVGRQISYQFGVWHGTARPRRRHREMFAFSAVRTTHVLGAGMLADRPPRCPRPGKGLSHKRLRQVPVTDTHQHGEQGPKLWRVPPLVLVVSRLSSGGTRTRWQPSAPGLDDLLTGDDDGGGGVTRGTRDDAAQREPTAGGEHGIRPRRPGRHGRSVLRAGHPLASCGHWPARR